MKTKTIVILIVVLGLLLGGFYVLNNYIYEEKQGYVASDFKNAEYIIEGQRVRLVNGAAETTETSASKISTKYFGNELKLDLNDDGREDVVFLVTQNTGGSGTFFYVVAALNTARGYVGSEAFLLGDRIAPQTTERSKEKNKGKVVIVNYADRAPGQPFTTPPSLGKSVWLFLDPVSMQFGVVEQNFEGEANPESMTLDMKKWNWIDTTYSDGKVMTPKDSKRFTLTFSDSKTGAATAKTFSATTDCNGVGGEYLVNGSKIAFTKMMSTLMFCNDSQEQDFTKMLSEVESFHFTSRGELIFDLKMDSGSAIFN